MKIEWLEGVVDDAHFVKPRDIQKKHDSQIRLMPHIRGHDYHITYDDMLDSV